MASKLLGAHVKRKEDPRLITGTSQYVGDVAMPGMQHVAFVRSPHAHAKVRGIKTAAAQKQPGVVAVVTGQDLKPHCAPIPTATASAEGGAAGEVKLGRQHYPLSVDRVRYVGEPVAAVIGTSAEAAEDADEPGGGRRAEQSGNDGAGRDQYREDADGEQVLDEPVPPHPRVERVGRLAQDHRRTMPDRRVASPREAPPRPAPGRLRAGRRRASRRGRPR